MLSIRPESISILSSNVEKRFRDRISTFVMDEHSEHLEDLNHEEQESFIDAMFSEGHKFACQTDTEFMMFSAPCAVFGALSHYDPVFQPIYYSSLNWSTACIRRPPEVMVDKLAEILNIEFADYSGVELMLTMGKCIYDASGQIRLLTSGEDLEAFCNQVFPSRYARLSQRRLNLHFSRSFELATNFGLESESGIFFYQQIAFVLGTEFGRDPLYPWANSALCIDAPEVERLTQLSTALIKIINSTNQQGLG